MAEVLCVYQEVAILRAVESDAVKACPGPAMVLQRPETGHADAAKAIAEPEMIVIAGVPDGQQ